MSGLHNAGQSLNIKKANKIFRKCGKVQICGNNSRVLNQNYIHEGMKSTLHSGIFVNIQLGTFCPRVCSPWEAGKPLSWVLRMRTGCCFCSCVWLLKYLKWKKATFF